jgi:energy-coupling factor transporter ATP-binding protein EcfA2
MYGLPLLLAGLAAALAGLWLGGRRSLRTRYRPDPGAYAPGWSPRPARRSRAADVYASYAPSLAALHPGVVPLTAPTSPCGRRRRSSSAWLPAFVAPYPQHTRPKTPARTLMIRFENVSVTYDGAAGPTVQGVDSPSPRANSCCSSDRPGVGKSTVLGAVNGLVPHFTGGTLRGRVTVAGRDTRTHKPRELADVVGTVGQDPLSHFVTDTVEDELAYGMESLGLAPDVMRRRVEETLDLLGLADLRDRPIATLSGGQQQRVAIGSVLTPHPKVLVLDEPTSALDPAAAEEVLAVLQRLVHDLGTTVLMAEHRLERVIQYADQVALLPAPGAPGPRHPVRGHGRLPGVPTGGGAGPARRLVTRCR